MWYNIGKLRNQLGQGESENSDWQPAAGGRWGCECRCAEAESVGLSKAAVLSRAVVARRPTEKASALSNSPAFGSGPAIWMCSASAHNPVPTVGQARLRNNEPKAVGDRRAAPPRMVYLRVVSAAHA